MSVSEVQNLEKKAESSPLDVQLTSDRGLLALLGWENIPEGLEDAHETNGLP